MTPNTAQRTYLKDNPKLKEFQGNREIILKARQMGFSTFIAAKMFLATINVPNTQSIIIAQDENNSKKLFQIIKRFYDNLPPQKKSLFPLTTDAKGELSWGSIDSSFFVGWAGSKKIGRGGTVNHVHASEVAFWEDAGEIVGGLLQSVPAKGNVFLESTANGVDNYFYVEYQAALKKESIYNPRFYPWYIDPSYISYSLLNGEEFVLNEEEEELQDRFQLSIPQLVWRRNKTLELKNARVSGDDSQGLFPQEYPSTASEAFLVTGASYYDTEILEKHFIPRTSSPLNIEIPPKYPTLRGINGKGFERIELWSQPKVGKRYIISADPSEGINNEGDHDYCSADILDFDTFEQVGQLYGRWDPDTFGEILWELSRWFNMAFLAVLRNNHGHAVLNTIINRLEYPKKSIYHYRDFDAPKTKRITPRPGFPENVKTKYQMLDALGRLINDYSITINSARSCEQLKLYSKLPGGKTGCLIGHDDCVSSLALGAYVISDPRIIKKTDKTEGKTVKKSIGGSRRGAFV